MEENLRLVDGFVFTSNKEAQLALQEYKNIEVIRERTTLSDAQGVYQLYQKLIERDMFKTIVGYSFLSELRHRLVYNFGYQEEDLPTVTIPQRMEYDQVREINQGVLESKLQKALLMKKRMGIAIVMLVIMIGAMFAITAINPNAGYINTENKILNKYAAWQEDLEQREKAIEEKEEELNIDSKK